MLESTSCIVDNGLMLRIQNWPTCSACIRGVPGLWGEIYINSNKTLGKGIVFCPLTTKEAGGDGGWANKGGDIWFVSWSVSRERRERGSDPRKKYQPVQSQRGRREWTSWSNERWSRWKPKGTPWRILNRKVKDRSVGAEVGDKATH